MGRTTLSMSGIVNRFSTREFVGDSWFRHVNTMPRRPLLTGTDAIQRLEVRVCFGMSAVSPGRLAQRPCCRSRIRIDRSAFKPARIPVH